MPYHKFRPLAQYGRFNTRTFRNRLRRRIEMDRMPIYIDPEVAASNVEVHDPLNPNFFKQLSDEYSEFQRPQHLIKTREEEHVLYKQNPCYLFDGKIGLTDGLDEACAIIKAPSASSFPEGFFHQFPLDDLLPKDFAEKVKNSIMHGERYDQTLEKLPKRHDPIIFWVFQPRLHGTPVVTRNNIIMRDLYRSTLLALMSKRESLLSDFRCDFDSSLSGYVAAESSGFQLPLVLRQQPHLLVQLAKPLTPLASAKDVEQTRSLKVPNIYPISPVIDLSKTNIYNDTTLIPRNIVSNLHIGTIFSTRLQDQKYPWTTEQNVSNTIMNCFGAALAQSTRNGLPEFTDAESQTLKYPILAKAVQLVEGKFDFVAVQLNTLNLSKTAGDGDVKNLVWYEKAVPLYKPKPYYENMLEVEEFNFDAVRKFVSFLLYR